MGTILSDGTDVFYRFFVKPSLLPTCSVGCDFGRLRWALQGTWYWKRSQPSAASSRWRRCSSGRKASGDRGSRMGFAWARGLLGVPELQLTLLRTGSPPISIPTRRKVVLSKIDGYLSGADLALEAKSHSVFPADLLRTLRGPFSSLASTLEP